MSGYTLDQLLDWCVDDCLIDGYERVGKHIVVFHAGERMEMTPGKAESYLARAFGRRLGSAFGKGAGPDRVES